MDPTLLAQGGFAVALAFAVYVCRELWRDNRELRRQSREDQAAMLPALTKSTEALKTALEQSIRGRALDERERE